MIVQHCKQNKDYCVLQENTISVFLLHYFMFNSMCNYLSNLLAISEWNLFLHNPPPPPVYSVILVLFWISFYFYIYIFNFKF